jgi:hypothetical protein
MAKAKAAVSSTPILWKKGRGALGAFDPLLGSWIAEGTSAVMGKYKCVRRFDRILDDSFIQVTVDWQLVGRNYGEIFVFGIDPATKKLSFWSFSSDKKRLSGGEHLAKDLPRESLAFETEGTAGLTRMIYWPMTDGFGYATESWTKKGGWNRFVDQRFRRVELRPSMLPPR